MSDRLNDLRRQRALVAEQLAWIDREIAAAEKSAAPSPARSSAPALSHVASQAAQILATAAASTPPVPSVEVDATAEQIIEQYRSNSKSTQKDVKKGCFLYFYAALAFLVLVVFALYFFFNRGRS